LGEIVTAAEFSEPLPADAELVGDLTHAAQKSHDAPPQITLAI